jgi:hypothetical protein
MIVSEKAIDITKHIHLTDFNRIARNIQMLIILINNQTNHQ